MKKFAIKFTIFLLPVIIVLASVEHILGIKGDEYGQKKKMFLSKLNNIEVLSVGTSHGYRGINPEYFDYSGFNMAGQGQPLYYDEKIISKYGKDMKNLKLVIQPIDCFTMESNPNLVANKFFYSKYYGIPVQDRDIKDLLNVKNYSLIALDGGINSLKIAFNKLKARTMSETLYINPYGTLIDTTSETNNKELLSKKLAEHTINKHIQLTDSKCVKENEDSEIKTVENLRQMKIQEVIIIFPVHHFYSDDSRVQNSYARVQEFTNMLANQYNVKIYNYFDDKRFTDEDFYDIDHLNTQGSVKLSKIINEEILKPNLENK